MIWDFWLGFQCKITAIMATRRDLLKGAAALAALPFIPEWVAAKEAQPTQPAEPKYSFHFRSKWYTPMTYGAHGTLAPNSSISHPLVISELFVCDKLADVEGVVNWKVEVQGNPLYVGPEASALGLLSPVILHPSWLFRPGEVVTLSFANNSPARQQYGLWLFGMISKS